MIPVIPEKTYSCPLELAIALIGGKWKCVILWHLRKKTLRFSQLKRRLPGITQKMLAQQLRDLEYSGLILREVYPVIPPKVEYSLTDVGGRFMPILESMYKWGKTYANRFEIKIDTSAQEAVIREELSKDQALPPIVRVSGKDSGRLSKRARRF